LKKRENKEKGMKMKGKAKRGKSSRVQEEKQLTYQNNDRTKE